MCLFNLKDSWKASWCSFQALFIYSLSNEGKYAHAIFFSFMYNMINPGCSVLKIIELQLIKK